MATYDEKTKEMSHTIKYTLKEGGANWSLRVIGDEYISLKNEARKTQHRKIILPIKDEKKEAHWIEFENGDQWDEVNGFIHYNKETAAEEKVYCSICSKIIKHPDSFVGTGDGSGDSFAHRKCYFEKHEQDMPEKVNPRPLAEDLYTQLECTQELTKEYIKIVLEDIKVFDSLNHNVIEKIYRKGV